jgi:hypothetical protein
LAWEESGAGVLARQVRVARCGRLHIGLEFFPCRHYRELNHR